MENQLRPVTNLVSEKIALLLIDDDPLINESLGFLLKKDFQVYVAESRNQARAILSELARPPQLALVDLGLPPCPHQPDEGFKLIEDLQAHDPLMKILVLSGQSDEANIQHALTLGAVDFIPKPTDPSLLQSRLQHQLMLQQVEKKQHNTSVEVAIIGQSAAINTVREQINQFSEAMFPVLIEGESGTGKELIAKALHQQSSRKAQPYLVINCASIAPELLEAQLFGYVKGAFTGANKDHHGFFREVGEGSLFLDEIGELPYDLQAKLLRVLESGEYYRVGDTACLQSRARIIAATNKLLNVEIKQGQFRSDLYHRLSILRIHVPALRDREDDVDLLLGHFQKLYAGSIGHFELDLAAQSVWQAYHFPGNVRELRNVVIRLGTKYPGQSVNQRQLSEELELDGSHDRMTTGQWPKYSEECLKAAIVAGQLNLDELLGSLENQCISLALDIYDGKLSRVAKALHINRTTLYSRMNKNADRGK